MPKKKLPKKAALEHGLSLEEMARMGSSEVFAPLKELEADLAAATKRELGLTSGTNYVVAPHLVRVAFRLMVHADDVLSIGRAAYLYDRADDSFTRGIAPPGTLTEAEFVTLARVAFRAARGKKTQVAPGMVVGPQPSRDDAE